MQMHQLVSGVVLSLSPVSIVQFDKVILLWQILYSVGDSGHIHLKLLLFFLILFNIATLSWLTLGDYGNGKELNLDVYHCFYVLALVLCFEMMVNAKLLKEQNLNINQPCDLLYEKLSVLLPHRCFQRFCLLPLNILGKVKNRMSSNDFQSLSYYKRLLINSL